MYLALDEIAGVVKFPHKSHKVFDAAFPLWEKTEWE